MSKKKMEKKSDPDEEKKRWEEESRKQLLQYCPTNFRSNWQEDKAVTELMILSASRDPRYDKFVQDKKTVEEYLFTPGSVMKFDKYILFEEPIQIQTEYLIPGIEFIPQMVLSASITEQQIFKDGILDLRNGCPVTVSEITVRQRRNIFTFVNYIGKKQKLPVTYGEDVYIRLFETGTYRRLYLQFVTPPKTSSGVSSDRLSVTLSESKNRFCKFKIVHFDVNTQDCKIGFRVRTNARICIMHSASNKYLGWEDNTINLPFGSEKLACGYTYLNLNKQITSRNYWVCTTKTFGEGDVVEPKPSSSSAPY